MSSLPLKVLAVTLVVAFASPADAAKARKHKKVATASTVTRVKPPYWGTDLFPAGPIYWGSIYMGDDPDPFIRFQLFRDITGRLGGAM